MQNSISVLRSNKERRARVLRLGAAWRRYSDFFSWFLRDSLWHFKFRVLTVTVLSFLSVIFQIAALGQALTYAKLLKSGKTITFLGHTFDIQTSSLMLFLVSLGVLGTLILSGGLIYWARKMSIGIAVDYEEFTAKRTLRVLGSHLNIHSVWEKPYGSAAETMRLITGDARMCARSIRVLIDAVIPVFSIIAYGLILLYMDIWMTAVVATIVAASGIAFYQVSKKGIASSRNMEASMVGARQEKNEILKWLISTPEFLASYDPFIEKPFRDGQTKKNQEAFKERLLTVDRSIFVSNLTAAVVFCLTIIYFAGQALQTSSKWGALAVYLISLRICLSNIQNLTRRITSVNRYYPIIRRLYLFLRDTNVSCAEFLSKPEITPVISARKNRLSGSQGEWYPKQGSRAAVLTVAPLNRYSLGFLIHSLVGKSNCASVQAFLANTYFVIADTHQPEMSLKMKLRCYSEDEWSVFWDSVPSDSPIRMLLESFPFCIDTTLSPKQWRSIDLPTVCAINLLAAWRSTCAWVFVEKRVLDVLDSNVRSWILKRLCEKVVFVFYSSEDTLEICHGEDAAIVVGNGEVIGLGGVNWAENIRKTIKSELQMLSTKYSPEVAVDDFMETEDDM